MEQKEEWRARGYDKDSNWSLTPCFCQIWGQFCLGRWTKTVSQNQRGEWKSGSEVIPTLWTTTNAFSSSSPKEKYFILPVMKDSVSSLVPNFTVLCPGPSCQGPVRQLGVCCHWDGSNLLLASSSSAPLSQKQLCKDFVRSSHSEQLIR